MAAITMVGPLRGWTQGLAWKPAFPGADFARAFLCPLPGPGQVFRPLAHPGTLILVVAALSVALVPSAR